MIGGSGRVLSDRAVGIAAGLAARGVRVRRSASDSVAAALDAIVPGGGQLHDGTEPPHMRARLDAARRRWAAAASPKPLIVCLSAGTPHKPNPRDARGFDAKEATASARYLLAGGRADFWPSYDGCAAAAAAGAALTSAGGGRSPPLVAIHYNGFHQYRQKLAAMKKHCDHPRDFAEGV